MSVTTHRAAAGLPARAARVLLVAAVLAAGFVGLVGPAQPAHAANYQFWGYYQLTGGKWAFAATGPAETKPADGATEGWRWAVDDGTGQRFPRATPSFGQVCDATPAAPGRKRVAVVIDSGRDADGDGKAAPPAPVARCASVAAAASGTEVLAAVATVRAGDKGLICGINNYPVAGCGGVVAALTDAQKAPDTPVTIGAAGGAPPTAPPTAAAPTAPASSTPPTTTSAAAVTPSPAATTPAPAPTVAAQPAAGAPTGTEDPSSFPTGIVVGLLVLFAVASGIAWSASRRRRSGA